MSIKNYKKHENLSLSISSREDYFFKKLRLEDNDFVVRIRNASGIEFKHLTETLHDIKEVKRLSLNVIHKLKVLHKFHNSLANKSTFKERRQLRTIKKIIGELKEDLSLLEKYSDLIFNEEFHLLKIDGFILKILDRAESGLKNFENVFEKELRKVKYNKNESN